MYAIFQTLEEERRLIQSKHASWQDWPKQFVSPGPAAREYGKRHRKRVRFFQYIQWIASERARKSVIPFGFWECSAIGSLLMLSYFAIYQRDSVGVLSTAMPLPIYLRNLYFRYTHRDPQHPGNALYDALFIA